MSQQFYNFTKPLQVSINILRFYSEPSPDVSKPVVVRAAFDRAIDDGPKMFSREPDMRAVFAGAIPQDVPTGTALTVTVSGYDADARQYVVTNSELERKTFYWLWNQFEELPGVGKKALLKIIDVCGDNPLEFLKRADAAEMITEVLPKRAKADGQKLAESLRTIIETTGKVGGVLQKYGRWGMTYAGALKYLQDIEDLNSEDGPAWKDHYDMYMKEVELGWLDEDKMKECPVLLARYGAKRADVLRAMQYYKAPFKQSYERQSYLVCSAVTYLLKNDLTDDGSTAFLGNELDEARKKLSDEFKRVCPDSEELQTWDMLQPFYGNLSTSRIKWGKFDYIFQFPLAMKISREIALRLNSIREHVKGVYGFDKVNLASIQMKLATAYDEDQLEAFNLLQTTGIKIITGGPGTGKTTILKGLIMAAEEMGLSYLLMSPTGKAAQRMAEATGKTASTIHHALGIIPTTEGDGLKTDTTTIDARLVVIDEASMLDEALFLHVLEKLRPGAILLLIGDEDQLESIGAGAVLRDLLRMPWFSSVRLKKTYRQAGKEVLLDNIAAIREGRVRDIRYNKEFVDQFSLVAKGNSVEWLQKAALYYGPQPDKNGRRTWDLDQCMILSPLKKRDYDGSTYDINVRLHDICITKTDGTKRREWTRGGYSYSVGDPVIMTTNTENYKNGDTGTVTGIPTLKEIQNHTAALKVKLFDGRELDLTGEQLEDVEPAYAITIHKSQGSGSDTVIVMLPHATPDRMLVRNLLYVAVTRARKRVVVICEDISDLAQAITTPAPDRTTCLLEWMAYRC